jgi:hypothetical protein
MLAVHFDNLIFILLVAVALLFRWLASKAGQASKDSQEPKGRSTSTPPPLPGAEVETDDERIRKFLEALGQPTTSKPPPPVLHRTDLPPRSVAPIQPPLMRPFSVPPRPLTPEERSKRKVILHEESVGEPGEWLRKINYPGQIPRPPVDGKVLVPKLAEPTKFEVHGAPIPPVAVEPPASVETSAEGYAIATQAISKPSAIEMDMAALLGSVSGLRNAIILREIFGPPRGLQPLDFV